ncbi:MAG: hypothetical protein VCA36_09545 [Opitutales bacterium]
MPEDLTSSPLPRAGWLRLATVLTLCCASSATAAIDIIFDYSFDTGNYFTDERRYVMDQAAYAFESRLASESFGSLDPDDYGSTLLNFTVGTFNPTTKASISIDSRATSSEGNKIGSPNEVLIFLGAKAVGTGSYLAVAGSGYGYSGSENGTFINYWDNTRNSSSNFDSVGGAISVNSSFSFYADTDLTTSADATSSSLTDFYSVMAHEIGHIMGFSDAWDAWNANLSGNNWTGANGKAAYNNQNVPIDASSKSHFGTLTAGNINCACHPVMLTAITANTRQGVSELDFALFKDIGYSISASPQGTNVGGTYTDPDPSYGGNYYVPVAEDYATWLARTGGAGGGGGGGGVGGGGGGGSGAPEPATTFTLLGLALVCFAGWREWIRREDQAESSALES